MIKLTALFEQKQQVEGKDEEATVVLESESLVSPEAIEAVVTLPNGKTHVQLGSVNLIVKESLADIEKAVRA